MSYFSRKPRWPLASSSGHRFQRWAGYPKSPIRPWCPGQRHKHLGRSTRQELDQKFRNLLEKVHECKQQHLPECTVPQYTPPRQRTKHREVILHRETQFRVSSVTEEPLLPGDERALQQIRLETGGAHRQ